MSYIIMKWLVTYYITLETNVYIVSESKVKWSYVLYCILQVTSEVVCYTVFYWLQVKLYVILYFTGYKWSYVFNG